MSWLFGINKGGQAPIGDAPQVPVPGDGGANDGQGPVGVGSADGYRSEAYSFDSTALERAAKAAKVVMDELFFGFFITNIDLI